MGNCCELRRDDDGMYPEDELLVDWYGLLLTTEIALLFFQKSVSPLAVLWPDVVRPIR